MAALESLTALPSRGHTYAHLQVADSARAHFGDNYTIYYTSNGSIPVGASDRDALTGPLNVSSATQGLILITTNIENKLRSDSLLYYRDGTLRSAVSTFRATLQTFLPTSMLASMSPRRAALLPATDLVAVLSESVLLFSNIDVSITSISNGLNIGPSSSEVADVATEITDQCADWSLKLEELNSVLTDYITVLKCESDAEADRRSHILHNRISKSFARHQLLPIYTNMAREATNNTSIHAPHPDHPSDTRFRLSRTSHLSDAVRNGSSKSHTMNGPDSRWYDFAFEQELFQSSVYSRNLERTASVSTARSTVTAHTCSVLSYLSLADVSIVSVLRLPIKARALGNGSSYELQRHAEVANARPAGFQQLETRSDSRLLPHNKINPQCRPETLPSGQAPQPKSLELQDTLSNIPTDFVSGELCDDCQIRGHRRFYCNVCSFVFCDPCWERQFLHRTKPTPGTLPHEKTDYLIAKKISNVLTPLLKEEQREKLLMDDLHTTWFGVVHERHDTRERILLQDYGRYATLIADVKRLRLGSISSSSTSSKDREALYPSLVSFVGQVGTGKSSLIKLLIDLKSDENEPFETPVIGAVGQDVATTADVRLYLDPDPSESQAPLLFADCEGFGGGEYDPVGTKIKGMVGSLQSDASSSQRKPTSDRELIWADASEKQSRDNAVARLYPRLLYTLSDVIVFVLKDPRVAERVFEQLVDWAAAATERNSNQSLLPQAIIAFNASSNDTPEELWDVEQATAALMDSLSRTVYHNDTFKKYAQSWRVRGRQIETWQELVLSYYSSFRVVRIPTTGRPMLIRAQVEKLSTSIRWATKEARVSKLKAHMLLDADEFQPYLETAFDHFADRIQTPFEFVQASFTKCPIPWDFGDNILSLAVHMMAGWRDIAKASAIFEEISHLIASSILLNATRNKFLDRLVRIFPEHLEHLDNALDNFCDRHWPCEYVDVKRQGARCVNVRSGHGAKGHQSKSGKIFASGGYVSSFTFTGYHRIFQNVTYSRLVALSAKVDSGYALGIPKEQTVVEIHRELILPTLFKHVSIGDVQSLTSQTVCLSCLMQPPKHVLPCRHVLCTPCLSIHGETRSDGYVEVSACPMHGSEKRFEPSWKVDLLYISCHALVSALNGRNVGGL